MRPSAVLSCVGVALLMTGLSAFAEEPGDCCWCDPNPNWGTEGSGDDPTLALDNRRGYGPENTHIEDPYDGRYFIKAHYFEDRGGGSTTVTARIWIDGVLAAEVSEVMTKRYAWDVGYIDWPEKTFTQQANDLEKPDHRSCWDPDD